MQFGLDRLTSDDRLNEKLLDWHQLLDRLKPLEEKYLLKEAGEDFVYSKLFISSDGSTVAQKEAMTHANPEFVEFKRDLAFVRAEYLDCKRRLELKIKAFEAEYLVLKVEAEAIKKHR